MSDIAAIVGGAGNYSDRCCYFIVYNLFSIAGGSVFVITIAIIIMIIIIILVLGE